VVTIRIPDVPDDVVAILRRNAAAAGQSLSAYVRDQFIAGARRPDPAGSARTTRNQA